MEITNVLKRLCEMYLPTSHEGDKEKLVSLIKEYADDVSVSKGGSVVARVGNGEEKILIASHYDEVNMSVSEICGENIKVISPFGADIRTVIGSPLKILGSRKISATALKKKDAEAALTSEELLIYTGLSEDELTNQVKIGAPVLYEREFTLLSENKITASALDNRIGCLISLMLIEALSKENNPNRSYIFAFTSEEEAGCRGAKTVCHNENISSAIVFDVTFALSEGVSERKAKPLGSGAAIGVSPVLNNEMTQNIIKLCIENEIPHTKEVMGGKTGTDADLISSCEAGVKTALISVPIKSMHTAVELCNKLDIEAAFNAALRFLR